MTKLIKNLIKIAAIALTSPATWAVAGSLYDNPFQRILVQIAALILIEGALILGWWQLDNDRQATMPQRVLHATLSGVAYIALWSIAIAHGEGAAGITFRLTLGVLLGYSVFESGILANIRLNRAKERNPNRYYKVRQARRKSDIKVATEQIKATEQVVLAQLKIDTREALNGQSANGEKTVRKLAKRTVSANTTKRKSAQDFEHRLRVALDTYPDMTKTALAKHLGVGRTKLYDGLKALENGNGHRRERAGVE